MVSANRIEIVEKPLSGLAQHATTPISFTVESVFDVRDTNDGRCELVERPLRMPYVKDYDAFEPLSPDARRKGVGQALFTAAGEWARAHGCGELKVETQNTNVPACRFYAAQGCKLRAVNRGAYTALPEEVQPLWYKNL